jgi:peptidoglycan/xylan/chitin deacetylase (PgdA/CDA1 family)
MALLPEITEWVLERLNYTTQILALGKNIEAHHFEKLIQKKHSIGNHTFNHLNGWKTTTDDYSIMFSLREFD